jgi:hypothetical protein
MESSPKYMELYKKLLLDNSISDREYDIGKGTAFKNVLFPIVLLNGLICLERYSVSLSYKKGALLFLGSYPIAYYIASNLFGDTKLYDLGYEMKKLK